MAADGPTPSDVTRLLAAASGGDGRAAEELLPIVYEELRVLAHRRMARERPGQTLQPTALVHEAYLRLLGPEGDSVRWENRGHFFGAAAEAMRRILIERARRVARLRHGGGRDRLPLENVDGAVDAKSDDLIALDEALKKLEAHDPRMAEVVKLRYFAGLGVEETATAMNVSPRTVKREWAVARAWLYERMSE